MPRSLARAAALAAALLAVPALAPAEPLDLDLSRLGAPSEGVYLAADGSGTLSQDDARALARAARMRFGLLSVDAALAFSSAVLAPASTTGHSGFDFALETAYAGVHPGVVAAPAGVTDPLASGTSTWPTRAAAPRALILPSVHARKALPFSVELGGRVISLARSGLYAGQVEAKWAVVEGFELAPEIALRAAWTQVFGQRDWNLGAGDLDLVLSKRWGAQAILSLTPYLAARYTLVRASTDPIAFAPAAPSGPAQLATSAAFPGLRAGLYRATAGLRMTARAVTFSAEATWLPAATVSGGAYPSFSTKAAWSGAGTVGVAL